MRSTLLSIVILSFTLSSVSSATMLREVWNDTVAASLQVALDVVNSGNPPDEVVVLDEPAWTNIAQNYVARVSGWLTVPQTGTYTFYIASDDNSGLYVSPDEEMANAVLMARVPSYTGVQVWTTFPQQTAVPMALKKGQIMALYAVMQQGDGPDNLAIGWTGPGISTITLIIRIRENTCVPVKIG